MRKTLRNLAAVGLTGLTALLGGCKATVETVNHDNSGYSFNADILYSTTQEGWDKCKEGLNKGMDGLRWQDIPNGHVNNTERRAEPSEGAYFTGSASATFGTEHIQDNIVVGRGPVVQSQINVARNDNLVKGDRILVGAFGNYDTRDGIITNANFNAEVKRPFYTWEHLMRGYDSPNYGDFASLGYEYRQYPNGILGKNDFSNHVLYASWLHSSRVDLEFKGLYLLPDSSNTDGQMLKFIGSKKIEVGKLLDSSLCINPFVSTGYAHDWYGVNGFTAVTSGIDVSLEKPRSFITGKVQSQSTLNENVKNALGVGIEAGYRF